MFTCQVGLPRQKMKYRFNRASIYSQLIRSISVTKERIKTLEKNRNINQKENVALTQDHYFLKSRRTTQATNCQKLSKRYFEKKKKKNRCFKKLKNHIKCNFEEQILASLKLSDTVSLLGICYKRGINAITGAAGLVEPLDTRVSEHLKYTFVLLICYCPMVFVVG